ncbi:MAG: glutathione S-transferase N-terminal domain-containing protein [Candidatus Caenarcaniphilales bacterium]|nr:glutathione S-transferase N-terminal domain-containing protein [Candidatus Caenarcaniphilales bacterium]
MIDLYTSVSPNGHKVAIMLEECGLDYKPHFLEMFKGEASTESHLKRNPLGKIPVIVDHSPAQGDQPFTLFESGAILQYLADKTGKFLQKEPVSRAKTIQWLYTVNTGLAMASLNRFVFSKLMKEPNPQAIEKFTEDFHRYLKVYESVLAENDYLNGEYSIADIALYAWLKMEARINYDQFTQYPSLVKFMTQIDQRPAAQKGMISPEILASSAT